MPEVSLREVLLGRLVDDASLFPPARTPIAEAVDNHSRVLGDPYGWMLDRFLCPASSFDELAERAPQDGTWSFGVILDGDSPERDLKRHRSSFDAANVRLVEARLSAQAAPSDARRLASLLAEHGSAHATAMFLEVSTRDEAEMRATLRAISGVASPTVLGAKLRCGGDSAVDVPSDAFVAAFLEESRALHLPFKLTAGLHHPFREIDEATGALHHGFINLLAATALDPGLAAEIIGEKNDGAFRLDEELWWNSSAADIGEVLRARELFTGFGSCCFDDAVAGLRAAGFLGSRDGSIVSGGTPRASPGADELGFGIENLPYGVARFPDGEARPVTRFGDRVLDLRALARASLLPVDPRALEATDLNPFLRLGRAAWSATRARLTELLLARERHRDVDAAFFPLDDAELQMPVSVGDFVDFYASLEHATNLGHLFRPDQEPLLPNWRHLPVGYHGRSGSVVVSGTPIRRPVGQRPPETPGGRPGFGPERWLDFELELGFVTGDGPEGGGPISVEDAENYVLGIVLVNDWSARTIQRWEYQPLGPFLGKSFATSISPWIVPLEALEPFRVEGPEQSPAPCEYLRTRGRGALNVELEVGLRPHGADRETVVTRTTAEGLYWTMAQQLAHATVAGAPVRAGDLFASGTISGPDRSSYGSLVELTWGGRDMISVEGGQRTFLEDGDTVAMRGMARRHGVPSVSLGEIAGTIEPVNPHPGSDAVPPGSHTSESPVSRTWRAGRSGRAPVARPPSR